MRKVSAVKGGEMKARIKGGGATGKGNERRKALEEIKCKAEGTENRGDI